MNVKIFEKMVLYLFFFKGIYHFIREYKEGFKHKNKKIEKKFNKIGKKLILKLKIHE